MTATKKRFVLIFTLIITGMLTLTACQEPVAVTFDQVCQVENNQQFISTDGYFSLGTTVYCSDTAGDFRCGLVFNSYPDGDQEFSAELKEGNRKNMMRHLESGYLEEDLQIKTDSRDLIGVGQHVTVTGEMLVTKDVCLMYVDKIENYTPASTP
jgi:hypothetical protein